MVRPTPCALVAVNAVSSPRRWLPRKPPFCRCQWVVFCLYCLYCGASLSFCGALLVLGLAYVGHHKTSTCVLQIRSIFQHPTAHRCCFRVVDRQQRARKSAVTEQRLMVDSTGAAGLPSARAAVCSTSTGVARVQECASSGYARPRARMVSGRGGTSVGRRRRLSCPSLPSSANLLAICLLLPRAVQGFVPVRSPSFLRRPEGCYSTSARCGVEFSSETLRASPAGRVTLSAVTGSGRPGSATAASNRRRKGRRSCPSLTRSPRSPGGRQWASFWRLPAAAAAAAAPVEVRTGPAEDAAAGRDRIRAVRHAAGRVTRGALSAVRGVVTPSRHRRAAGVALVSAAALCFLRRPAIAAAIGGAAAQRGLAMVGMIPSSAGAAGAVTGAAQEIAIESVVPKLALWFTLFVTSAAFHSAEIAITTLYPWKVKEFAEEEGEDSPFQVLLRTRSICFVAEVGREDKCVSSTMFGWGFPSDDRRVLRLGRVQGLWFSVPFECRGVPFDPFSAMRCR